MSPRGGADPDATFARDLTPQEERQRSLWIIVGWTLLSGTIGLFGSLGWWFSRELPPRTRALWTALGALGGGAILLAIVLAVTTTRYAGPPASRVESGVQSTIRSHWDAHVTKVQCTLPGSWSPDARFPCFAYRDGVIVGTTSETVVPNTHNEWEWITSWSPLGG